MPIIEHTKGATSSYDTLLYKGPDQLVSEKEKEGETWIKENMDYYWAIATAQYRKNFATLKGNYELVKGVLKRTDFYEEAQPEIRTLVDNLLVNEDLPAYVKHYSILTPINTLIGEMTKRPDNVYVKAFDDNSKSEELQFKTDILQQYIIQNAKQMLSAKLAQQGIELETEEEFEQMTMERVEEYLTSYTSTAEKWASHMLEFLKVRFNIKEKSEDAFRDLLISAREFYHIYEDNSNIGLGIEVPNPVNVWYQTTPDEKYTSDPLNKNTGAYAAGIIDVMELSEILQKFNLTEEEIKHLRDYSGKDFLLDARESNLVSPKFGEMGIEYDTYDPAVLRARLENEAALMEDETNVDILGIGTNVGTYGYKYTVLRAYWLSKKKIGKLIYINAEGEEITDLVDENYKDGDHPQELSIEWTWVNQWYQGVKIGHDIYYVKPFTLFDYCPILGCTFEGRNTKPASLVDAMKPYQILYNVAMNQLFRLLEKDMGVVFLMSLRHIPVPKDGAHEDAVEMWEAEAREKGVVFVDDSPENLKGTSSFNNYNAVNLSRSQEIQARYELALAIRTECWKLVGISEQRQGNVTASESATGTNAALSQSYAQTESWFSQHEYLLNKVYQAMLDATMYIESNKPNSTVSYITNEGTHAFVQVNGSELKLKDIGVLITSRQEDAENLRQMKLLAQSMLQNGADPYTISLLYNSKSSRFIQDSFKKLKDKAEQFQQQQQQLEEQKLQQAEQQFAQQQELLQLQLEKQQAFEAYQAEQDRLSAEKIAYIRAASGMQSPDTAQFDNESLKLKSDYDLKTREITQKQQELLSKSTIEQRKLEVDNRKIDMEKYKADTALKIARENRVGERAKAKTKK